MAERRMFTKKITDSDAFTEMSSAAQALYFHLNQGADDDGFNNQIQMAMFKAHASTDDLKILLAKNFIIRFESGVIVIKHWRMHNTIRKDRYTPTNFKDELEQLGIKENGAYTHWLPNGCQMVATGKDSIGKVSEDKDIVFIEAETTSTPPKKQKPPKHKYGEYNNVLLSDDELEKLKSEFPDWEDRIERLSEYIAQKGNKYKSHYVTIKAWARKDKEQTPQPMQKKVTMDRSYEWYELGQQMQAEEDAMKGSDSQ